MLFILKIKEKIGEKFFSQIEKNENLIKLAIPIIQLTLKNFSKNLEKKNNFFINLLINLMKSSKNTRFIPKSEEFMFQIIKINILIMMNLSVEKIPLIYFTDYLPNFFEQSFDISFNFITHVECLFLSG